MRQRRYNPMTVIREVELTHEENDSLIAYLNEATDTRSARRASIEAEASLAQAEDRLENLLNDLRASMGLRSAGHRRASRKLFGQQS